MKVEKTQKIKSVLTDSFNYIIKKKYLNKYISDFQHLPDKIFKNSKPVFVLSTGRCGTDLLVKLFCAFKAGKVYHEPKPEMVYSSKVAYELSENGLKARMLGFISGRYDALRESFLRNQRYIETNNRITFFSDAIYEMFPNSKFIHLVRHPGDFARSGIRRRYYYGHDYDDGRLTPVKTDPIFIQWDNMSQLKKIGWLWNETNQYIESIKNKFASDRIITIKAENLFRDPSTFITICSFLDLSPPNEKKIKSILKKPRNVQYKGFFPRYTDWSDEQKQELIEVATLAPIYGYQL
ncbi:MAG: sulfotransferase [Candidatus Marinimicrobia bacterium]|nr:sulfotransferase [Candidatus Neomarinimicrobiota bacterium]